MRRLFLLLCLIASTDAVMSFPARMSMISRSRRRRSKLPKICPRRVSPPISIDDFVKSFEKSQPQCKVSDPSPELSVFMLMAFLIIMPVALIVASA